MAQGKKITKKQWNNFLENLEQMIGLIGATCEKTGIGRWAYYKHRREDKEFAKEADKIMDQIGTPFMEDKLREACFEGQGWAIKFYLQCKSKKWRPVEKREFPGGLKMEVEQKIRTDPILKKAVKFYEEELKKKYRKGDSRRKHAGVDRQGRNKKRKRRTN
jgi:hypothetical protein